MRFTQLLRKAAPVRSRVLIKVGEGQGHPTGLAGIYQHPNPRPALIAAYNETLRYLNEEFPTHSIYRQATENLTKARLEIVEKNEVIEVIEKKISCGLIEELLIQAAEERQLAETLAKSKWYEVFIFLFIHSIFIIFILTYLL